MHDSLAIEHANSGPCLVIRTAQVSFANELIDLVGEFVFSPSLGTRTTDIDGIETTDSLGILVGKKSPILKSVDKSAKAAASAPTKVDRGFRPGKIGKTKVKVSGAARFYPAEEDSAVIRIYQSSMLRGGENKIKFQLYSEGTGDYVEKYVAYTDSEIGARLHRHHAYRVKFNANPKYPVIEDILEEL